MRRLMTALALTLALFVVGAVAPSDTPVLPDTLEVEEAQAHSLWTWPYNMRKACSTEYGRSSWDGRWGKAWVVGTVYASDGTIRKAIAYGHRRGWYPPYSYPEEYRVIWRNCGYWR